MLGPLLSQTLVCALAVREGTFRNRRYGLGGFCLWLLQIPRGC